MGNRGVETQTALQAVVALLALDPERSREIQRSYAEKSGGKALMRQVFFDCLWFNGQDLTELPLYKRKQFLAKAVTQLVEAGFQCAVTKMVRENKKQFYKSLVAKGEEGIVLKNLLSKYVATTSRKKDGWVKVKRTMTETMADTGLGDTLDAFVTGYDLGEEGKGWEGQVGSLTFSVILEKKDGTTTVHEIARVSNISAELRAEITDLTDPNSPKLKKEWYGKCASLDGQSVSARALRLVHAVIVEWRPDRSSDSCVMSEEFLKEMVL